MSINHLLNSITNQIKDEPKGRLLDLGCGNGDYSIKLNQLGFNVIAADMDVGRFKWPKTIPFEKCDVTKKLPFKAESFDYIILAEVIEHLKNPYDVMAELNRILRPGGKLIISTPNILNMKSRLRYFFEGCWEYYREVPLEHSQNPKEVIWNLHLIPWRYHELEYLLHLSGFKIEQIATSIYEGKGMAFLKPLIQMQLNSKAKRSVQNGGINHTRINEILLSDEILFGRHLIIKAVKK